MFKKHRKSFVIGLVLTVIIGFFALVIDNYKTTSIAEISKKIATIRGDKHNAEAASQDQTKEEIEQKTTELTEIRKNSEILKLSAKDYAIGDKNAPVVFIEYASLSCPHCASFVRESFERLKTDYIDSGKILFVFRNFPLNQAALSAAMLAECQAKDNKSGAEGYFGTIKALFKTQDSWAFDAKFDERLEAIAKLDNMSSERFKSCMNDKALQEQLLTIRMEAAKELELKSVPSFFANGEASEGYVDYETLKKLIEKKLAEKQK